MNIPRLVAIAAVALGVSGCISLFPEKTPAQMYRFGASTPAAAEAGARDGEVLRGPIVFSRAASNDRIVTVNGTEIAYVAASRWVAPAPALFQEALERGFAATPGAPRLSPFGQGVAATGVLNLDVDAFEARYEQGLEAAPTIVVRIRARITHPRERQLLGEQVFEVRRPASENRVSAIVQAYDTAVSEALASLIAWTGQVV